jgi:hypothetical protein
MVRHPSGYDVVWLLFISGDASLIGPHNTESSAKLRDEMICESLYGNIAALQDGVWAVQLDSSALTHESNVLKPRQRNSHTAGTFLRFINLR